MLNQFLYKLMLTAAAQLIIPAKIKLAMTAGAYIVTTNLATTTPDVASKNKFLANVNAAVMLTDTTKFNAAVMFLSTTLKHAAKKNLSTMKLTNAKLAKDGFANNNANTYLNTIGNISAAKKAALFLALSNRYSSVGR